MALWDDASSQGNKPIVFMKIFLSFSVGNSAVSDHFLSLADELHKRGHEVHILSWGRSGKTFPFDKPYLLHHFPSKRPTRFRDALFLTKLIRKYKPDCLIANFGSVNLMMLIGFLLRVPIRICWYRTMSGQLAIDFRGSKVVKELLKRRKSITYALATNIAANSLSAKKDCAKVYRVPLGKIVVFYNSLKDPFLSLQKIRTPDREDENLLRLVVVGRLSPSKGHHVLLQAMAVVRNSFPFVELFIVGDGSEREKLQALAKSLAISDSCNFIGSVPHADVYAYLKMADVAIVPSFQEAFGFVALEAMAMRVPVIASAVGGLKEVVRDGVDGLLVPPGDVNNLAQAILKLLGDEKKRKIMGKHARRRFEEVFEQQVVVEKQADWLFDLFLQKVKKA